MLLLKSAKSAYRQAKFYRLEVEHSEAFRGELSGNWSHSFQTAIVAPGGKYRFEAIGPEYSWLQVSDGNSEWIYDANSKTYERLRTSAKAEPSPFGEDSSSFEESKIADAREIPESISEELGRVRDSQLVGSEVLALKNGNVDCLIVRGSGRYMSGWSPDTNVQFTFWLEKGSNYVRKIEQHWEGQLLSGKRARYERDIVDLFNFVSLDASDLPANLFSFTPPATAVLVKEFTLVHPSGNRQPSMVGESAPNLIFHASSGQLMPLNSLRGRPVLIEFWATWCAPCVSAFPTLEKLYSELNERGLAVITVDEDDEADKATSFLAKRGHLRWPNYHDDGEINRQLPGAGLPQFVLIDAEGKIVLQTSGFDAQELRKQITSLISKNHLNR